MSTTTSPLLEIEDVRARFGNCSERFVRKLVAERRLPVVRLGRRTKFRAEDIDAYIAAVTEPAKRGPLAGRST